MILHGMKTLNASEFLSMVWPPNLLRNETLELRAKQRKDGVVSRRFASSQSDFLHMAKGFGPGWDIYFGVSTRLGKFGGKKQDCYRVNTLWVDFDKTEKLPDLKLKPDIIVNSGGGFHVYWLLESPIYVGSGRWKEVESINRGLMRKFGGDSMAIDVTRVLRVPDFFNYKYSPARKVTADAL